VSPLRGEKPQNRPLSKLNTGKLALRAMLPVISAKINDVQNINIFLFVHSLSLTGLKLRS